jgi:hypothetical protein
MRAPAARISDSSGYAVLLATLVAIAGSEGAVVW